MKNRETLDLTKSIGSSSTGYDHFRHVYEFVKALYKSLDTKHVDYDSRIRESITNDNFVQKKQEFDTMVQILSNYTKNKQITITASTTYPNFKTITSVQRELLELLKHEENHYRYLDSTHQNIPQHKTAYSLYQERSDLPLGCENIQDDIKQDIERYQSIPTEFLSDIIQSEYNIIIDRMNQLDQYNTNDVLIFNHTITSVSNEYYKIEEELVHLLYDILLFLKDNQQEFFEQKINQDPNFGIARSTLQSLTVS